MQTYELKTFLAKDPNGEVVKLEDVESAITKAKIQILKDIKNQIFGPRSTLEIVNEQLKELE